MQAGNIDGLIEAKIFGQPAFYSQRYSSSMAYAWLVVEKLIEEGHDITIESGKTKLTGEVQHLVSVDDQPFTASPSAPLAICLAALQFVDSKTR